MHKCQNAKPSPLGIERARRLPALSQGCKAVRYIYAVITQKWEAEEPFSGALKRGNTATVFTAAKS